MTKFIGTYYNELLKTDIVISVDAGQLMGRIEKPAGFTLSAIKPHVFNNIESGVVIEFYPEKSELVLIRQGSYLTFIRRD